MAHAEACELDDFGPSGGGHSEWSLAHYLSYVSTAMASMGWCSRARARAENLSCATADVALEWMVANYRSQRAREEPKHPVPSDGDRARAEAARAWAADLGAHHAALSDYEHDIMLVAKLERVDGRTIGLAASIISAHERAIEKAAERGISRWFGTVRVKGQKKYVRATFTLTVLAVISVGLRSEYGPAAMHIMRDPVGNKAVWTTRSKTLEVGRTYQLRSTVDAHETYMGEQQTVLSRCEVVEATSSLPMAA